MKSRAWALGASLLALTGALGMPAGSMRAPTEQVGAAAPDELARTSAPRPSSGVGSRLAIVSPSPPLPEALVAAACGSPLDDELMARPHPAERLRAHTRRLVRRLRITLEDPSLGEPMRSGLRASLGPRRGHRRALRLLADAADRFGASVEDLAAASLVMGYRAWTARDHRFALELAQFGQRVMPDDPFPFVLEGVAAEPSHSRYLEPYEQAFRLAPRSQRSRWRPSFDIVGMWA